MNKFNKSFMLRIAKGKMNRFALPVTMLCCLLCVLIGGNVKSEAQNYGTNQVRITVIGGSEGWCGNRVGQFAAYYSGRKIAVVYVLSNFEVFKGNKRVEHWEKYLPFQSNEKKSVIKGKKIVLVGEWSGQVPEIPQAVKEFHAYEIHLSPDIFKIKH
jgi:hypothetical protein